MSSDDKKSIQLYYNEKSICSSMVRLFIFEKGLANQIEEVAVDLIAQENAQEWFLRLNPKGQVPVIVDNGKSVPDSLELTYYLESRFPSPCLLPASHEPQIRALLTQLHAINFFSITYSTIFNRTPGAREAFFTTIETNIRDALAQPTTTPAQAAMLSHRLAVFQTEKAEPLLPPNVAHNWSLTEAMIATLENLRQEHALMGPYLFGQYTVIDAHTLPFLLRLVWLGRSDLVARVGDYWDALKSRESYKKVYNKECGMEGHEVGCRCK